MTKRIIVIGIILIVAYGLIVIGKQVLIGHYRKKADIALFLTGDYKAAIKYYSKVIDWKPDAAGCYYNRGDAYKGDDQFENALIDYKKSIEIGVNDSLQAILRIALCAKELNDLKMEEEMLLRLLDLSKNKEEFENEYWAANYNFGRLQFEKKEYRSAINYYNKAHSIKATEYEIYHRANAYFALGQIDSAKSDLRQSLPFLKPSFIKKYPGSHLATCDSCYFPFGSEEYELFTESIKMTILDALSKNSNNKELMKLTDELKSIEKSNK
ncbi:MAG: tetratricopeptide repeat protein [Cyclobacteriaceae bacterium]|nr:tetratricopeptide repeat protein [Cyclobacteriaceae bacterium]